MKILIVEDEFLIGEDLRSTLEELGYDVAGPATTRAEALAAIAEHLPNIAMIDTRLGTEDSEPVVQDCTARGIATIIMSGHGKDELPAYCRGLAYLGKPYSPDAVEAILKDIQPMDAGSNE
jgi:DNA-binding response OmpR family regulator